MKEKSTYPLFSYRTALRLLLAHSIAVGAITHLVHAEIPFTHIKGFGSVINPEKKFYSPLNGFSWWQTGVLEGMYRNGNQNDLTIQLVRELFYLQHDGITFGITTLNRKPARYFTPTTIGKIIAIVEQLPANPATMDAAAKERAGQQLFTTIAEDINLAAKVKQAEVRVAAQESSLAPFEKEKKEAAQRKMAHEAAVKKRNDELRSVSMKLKAAQQQGRAPLIQELEQRRAIIALELQKAQEAMQEQAGLLKKIDQSPEYRRIQQVMHNLDLTEKSVHQLVQLILGSLIECVNMTSRYVPGTTQAILLSFLWKRADNKEDFLTFFRQCPNILVDPSLDKEKQAQWLKEVYTKEEYENLKRHLTDAGWLIDHYEEALFCLQSQRVWDQLLPPIVASINTDYRHNGVVYNFPNCVETSLRNFFNIVLKDGDRLNIDLLNKSTEAADLKPSSALTEFYRQYSSLTMLPTKLVHDSWNQVVSNLPGVSYRHDNLYEIATSLDNVLQILNHLLFANDKKFAALPKKEKLDYLCEALSRPEWTLTWELLREEDETVNTKDVNLKIEFSINDDEAFTWTFLPHHSLVTRTEKVAEAEALRQTADVLINGLTGHNVHSDASILNLLSWLVSADAAGFSSTLEQMQKERVPAAAMRQVLFGIGTHNPDTTLTVIDGLLEAQKGGLAVLDEYIHSLIKGLPTYDYYYKTSLSQSIVRHKATAFYPLLDKVIQSIATIKDPEEQLEVYADMANIIISSRNKDPKVLSLLPQLLKRLSITSEDIEDGAFQTFIVALDNKYEPLFPLIREHIKQMGSKQLEFLQEKIQENNIVQLNDIISIIPEEFSGVGIRVQTRQLKKLLEQSTEYSAKELFKHLMRLPWGTQMNVLENILKKAPSMQRWSDKRMFDIWQTPSRPVITEPGKINKTLYNLFLTYIKALDKPEDAEKREKIIQTFLIYEEVISNAPLLASIAIKYTATQQPDLFTDLDAAMAAQEEKLLLKILLESMVKVLTESKYTYWGRSWEVSQLEALWWITFSTIPLAAKKAALETLFQAGVSPTVGAPKMLGILSDPKRKRERKGLMKGQGLSKEDLAELEEFFWAHSGREKPKRIGTT